MGPKAAEGLIPKDAYALAGMFCVEYHGTGGITGYCFPRVMVDVDLSKLDPAKVNPKALDAIVDLLKKYAPSKS